MSRINYFYNYKIPAGILILLLSFLDCLNRQNLLLAYNKTFYKIYYNKLIRYFQSLLRFYFMMTEK